MHKYLLIGIVTILAIIGSSAYFVLQQQNTPVAVSSTSCIGSLYSDDRPKYDFWKNKYGDLHAEFDMYDAGSYCLLSDGTQLVSFSYFKSDDSEESGAIETNAAEQSIALFDSNNKLIQETKNLHERTLGDLVAPHIDSVSSNIVKFSFSSGDAGMSITQSYELKLSDFSFTKTERVVEE